MTDGFISSLLKSLESNESQLARGPVLPDDHKKILAATADMKLSEVGFLAAEIAKTQKERDQAVKKAGKNQKVKELDEIIREGVVDLTKEVERLRRIYAELGKDPADLAKIEKTVATLVFQEDIDGIGYGAKLSKNISQDESCELKDLSLL